MNTKTHIVLDTFYTEDEGQMTFVGSFTDCQNFIDKQSYNPIFGQYDSHQHYIIVPLTTDQKLQYNP